MIGKIHLSSSKHHCFILVATDYFTKWVEAKPYKSIDQNKVISFIEDLIHRFSIRQTITVNNGIVFEGGLVRTFAEVLWAYRTSKRSSTGVTPFALLYGHNVVFPVEINIKSLRVKAQDYFDKKQYGQSICMELEDIDEARMLAINKMLIQKRKAARCYNKRVHH
ncbi:uncharacterized protein LOC114274920 [Camellia sinensis]|uniref:uncharacterized protein LOC114274920 n=1 Tax=Camellia sinensis TaxID=4442 RepID=UPI00103668C9|nr:uncharacterized protein LOC114274920 [Camellia sinensis]